MSKTLKLSFSIMRVCPSSTDSLTLPLTHNGIFSFLCQNNHATFLIKTTTFKMIIGNAPITFFVNLRDEQIAELP